jgi:hypothetical protein
MSSKPASPVDAADRLSRRRARVFNALAFFVLIQQFAFLNMGYGQRLVDHVRFGAWVLTAGLVLFVLTSGGFHLRGRGLRDLMNDEVTRANRGSALGFGFVAAMIVGIALYPFVGVLDASAYDCLRLVVNTGLVAGLIRFAMLERRALG